MQDKKSFGKYITKKRKEANLTQEEQEKLFYDLMSIDKKFK